MHIIRWTSGPLKRWAFGSLEPHQQCAIGLYDPQAEVSAQLHGIGAPRDVTDRNVIAAARPLMIGIGGPIDAALLRRRQASLKFYARQGKKQLLGVIGLRLKQTIASGDDQLYLFETTSCGNYCLPRRQLWARHLQLLYKQWRVRRPSSASDFRMVPRELRSVFVFYICPRPVVLVTVVDGKLANLFPMDLIGPISSRRFSLALHSTSAAVPLMERSRRIALSSVPIEQSSLAVQLGQNHKRSTIDWASVPFATATTSEFAIPVPWFSLRVREMEIEDVRNLGSHKLFVARTVSDQRWTDGQQLFFIHGSYHAWRQQRQV